MVREEVRKQKVKMSTFKARVVDIGSGENIVTLHQSDADSMGLHEMDRVKVTKHGKSITATVQTSETVVRPGKAVVYARTASELDVKDGDDLLVVPTGKPRSVEIIKAKMDGKVLSKDDLRTIVQDIVERRLTPIEVSAYVTANYIQGMNMDEITYLTKAMVETGETIDFATGPIFDFHSVGGSPGNKVTLIVVPIVMAAGLTIPKTSSRAISSACGTADIMEVLCNVTMNTEQIKSTTLKIGGCIAWGGGVNLAPADDLIIHVEYPLGIDPYGQLLASVMAKKKAVGADYMLLDIPMGQGTKVPTEELAKRYARDFIDLGERLGIKVECAVTYGGQPVGHAIGPALEAKEALAILEGAKEPNSVVMKATHLAGIILEMGGVASNGQEEALALLRSGKALEKFRQILAEQGGGDPDVKSGDIKVGKFKETFSAERDGYVDSIENKRLVQIARAAGAPKEHGAGLVVHKKGGRRVEKGTPLLTIYADNKVKLEEARRIVQERMPVHLEGMLLERIPRPVRVIGEKDL